MYMLTSCQYEVDEVVELEIVDMVVVDELDELFIVQIQNYELEHIMWLYELIEVRLGIVDQLEEIAVLMDLSHIDDEVVLIDAVVGDLVDILEEADEGDELEEGLEMLLLDEELVMQHNEIIEALELCSFELDDEVDIVRLDRLLVVAQQQIVMVVDDDVDYVAIQLELIIGIEADEVDDDISV